MSNTSYAKGTIHFKGFTFDEITNFVDANCFYSSDGYGFNDIYGETFDGFGLDTFESTLKESYWDFIPKGGKIELKFTDEEHINGIYYVESGTIYDNGNYVVDTKEILNMSEFNTIND